MSNISENTFEAVGLIVDSRLQQYEADKTIIASIVSRDKTDTTKYLVSYGANSFYAYADASASEYSNGQQIYVLIPNGDYTQKKIIVNAVPYDAIKKVYSMANRFSEFIKIAELGSFEKSNTEQYMDIQQILLYNTNYDAIGVTFTPLGDYELTSTDEFQIGFNLCGVETLDGETTYPKYTDSPILITNRDLRGNPYSLSSVISYDFLYPCTEKIQSNLTNIKKLEIISDYTKLTTDINFKITIWLGYTKNNSLINSQKLKIYSNKDPLYNEWKSVNDKLLEEQDAAIAAIAAQSLTAEQKEWEIKKIKAQTTEALAEANTTQRITYDSANSDIKLYLEAFGTPEVSTPYEPTQNLISVAVFRYRIGAKHDVVGINWEQIGYSSAAAAISTIYENSDWITNGGAVIDLGAGGVFFEEYETTRIKIYAYMRNPNDEYKDLEFVSPELVYYNKNKSSTTQIAETQELKLELMDGDSGIYNFYGIDGILTNGDKYRETRTVTVRDKDGHSLLNEQGTGYKEDIKSIEWIYPTRLTCIEPVWAYDTDGKVVTDANGNKVHEGLLSDGRWGDTFYYAPARKGYSTYINNTIECIVTNIENKKYTASISLEFGGFNNQNTPYSFNIDIDDGKRYLEVNGLPKKLKVTLERTDGEPTVNLSDVTVNWEFVEPQSNNGNASNKCKLLRGYKEAVAAATGYIYDSESEIGFEGLLASEEIYVLPPKYENNTMGPSLGYNAVIKLTAQNVQINDVSTQNIVAYLPLPIFTIPNVAFNGNTYMYQGPDRVIYTNMNECSYNNNYFALLQNGEEIEFSNVKIGKWSEPKINSEGIFSGTFGVTSEFNNIIKENYNGALRKWPSHALKCNQYVTETDENGNEIIVKDENDKPIYDKNRIELQPRSGIMINDQPNVDTIYFYTKIEGTERLIWIQPIITLRNIWENPMFDWDGKGLHQEENALYSPFIAAGGRDNKGDGTFTGVMLGKVQVDDKDNYGIFGVNAGNPRFYFTADGEAYIGNSEKQYGILLDDDGELSIDVHQFALEAPHLIIDSDTKQIDIYEDEDNTTLRVRLGWIKSNTYGLDIYNGAFVIYKDHMQSEDGKLFYTSTDTINNEQVIELYFKGRLQGNSAISGIHTGLSTNGLGTTITSLNKLKKSLTFWSGVQSTLYGFGSETSYGSHTDSLYMGQGIASSSSVTLLSYDSNTLSHNMIVGTVSSAIGGAILSIRSVGQRSSESTGFGLELMHLPSFNTYFHDTNLSSRMVLGAGTIDMELGGDNAPEMSMTKSGFTFSNGTVTVPDIKRTSSSIPGMTAINYRPVAAGRISIGSDQDSNAPQNGTSPVAITLMRLMYNTDKNSDYYVEITAAGSVFGDVPNTSAKTNIAGFDLWPSDIRLKTNIQNTTVSGLHVINQIQHASFEWLSNGQQQRNGYIAQQLEKFLPEGVLNIGQGDSNIKQIKVSGILPYVTKAIQELDEEIIALKQEIKELKNEIYK